MATTWVLVADSSRARLFSADHACAPLREIGDYLNPQGRVRTRDLVADRHGRSSGNGPNLDDEVAPRRQLALLFDKCISAELKIGRASGLFRRLYIAAAPAFLGLLRDKLDARTADLVVETVNKDLTQLPSRRIRQHLPERL